MTIIFLSFLIFSFFFIGLFPVAICVCDSETDANWTFFFEHLKTLLQGRLVTFMSDRGTGLLSAFEKVFAGWPHLFCYKHLVANLMDKFRGRGNAAARDGIRHRFFECAYSSSEKEFAFHLSQLRYEGGQQIIDDFLSDLPLESWCRAFFKGDRYGIMANSAAESFNNWIKIEREMPVFDMLDTIRLRLMHQMSTRRDASERWTTLICPNMEIRLKAKMEEALQYSVFRSVDGKYEVRGKFNYTVNLRELVCSCNKWQINCFPCAHALAAIQGAGRRIYDYIDPYYSVELYKRSYDSGIHPIPNLERSLCESSSSGTVFPPLTKRPPGRPKAKRIKSANESRKRPMKCGRCGVKGDHNKKTCTAPI